jgi:carboxymethylenebutenolidase
MADTGVFVSPATELKPTKEMLDLYNDYAHDVIDRRTFMDRLAKYAVGGVTLAMLAEMLMPKYATALQLAEDDPRIRGERIEYDSPNGAGKQGKKMGGYLVRPAKVKGKIPAVVIVHENRGLNPHIADVARRAAAAGYLAFAPDALYPLGGYPGTDDEGRTMQSTRNGAEMLEDFIAAVELMQKHAESTGKVGVTGFCYGGGVCNQLAIRVPQLAASVPYYGAAGAEADAGKVNAPLMVNLASSDDRINAGYPAWEAALKRAGKDVAVHSYPETQHGFHNDTTPRFNPEQARIAWNRTLEFWGKHLR